MTTEETELTFVRCPNCRSLIPAIATRCRMCGAQFEKKGENAEPPASTEAGGTAQRQSRVRQRTISASPEEVEQIKREAYQDDRGRDNGEHEAPADNSFRLGGGAPRRESIPAPQRYDEPEQEPEHEMEPEPVEDDRPYSGSAQDDFMEDVTATNVRTQPEPEEEDEGGASSFRFVDQAQEQREDWSDEGDFGGDDDSSEEEDEDEMGADDAGEDSAPNAAPARSEGKRRRRRRRKKRGGTQATNEIQAGGSMSTQQQNISAPSQQRNDAPRQQHHHEPRHSDSGRGDSGRGGMEASQTDGALSGWLAVFANNPQGESIELRAGKFFVGRQKLRGSDLVISDSSVSTPHCMITVGGDGIMVQDLMSEQGTHLRRAGSDSYSPLQQPTAVHHGDWLRFGQYEVLVCLLPKGRAS